MVKTLSFHDAVLEYRHQTYIHNQFDLKRKFLFLNDPELFLLSLKCIMYIIEVFIQFSYRFHSNVQFLPIQRGLSYNKLITFRYTLSYTSLNFQLYVLTDISSNTDDPLNARRILKLSQV